MRLEFRHVGQFAVREDQRHLAREGLAPFLAAATSAREQEAAFLQVLLEVLALVLGERERAFARHDREGELEDLLLGQLHRLEFPRRVDARLAGHRREEFLTEANGAFCAGVDDVRALNGVAAAGAAIGGAGRKDR